MQLTEYEIHPAANVFPMMDVESFTAFVADVRENGIKQDIVLFDGKVIDGRNRYKAMTELNIDPAMHACELDSCDDPIAYVLSLNLHRRHLSESQRSMVAGKIATLKQGEVGNGRKVDPQICSSTTEQAATLLNVSPRSVQSAKHVIDGACKELSEAVESGSVAVSLAEKLVKAVPDKREQKKLVTQGAKAIREYLNPPKPKDDQPEEIELPETPTESQVAEVEAWIEDQDERPGFERFMAVWNSCDKMAKAAIRAFVIEQ